MFQKSFLRIMREESLIVSVLFQKIRQLDKFPDKFAKNE